jgi:predicted ribosome quality control (RQC) complex YloA/Tae2 family protein
MTIINSLRFIKVKDRIIRPNEVYELPNPRFQELYLDNIEFKRTIKSSNKDSIVKTLAVDIGMGGKYAEELISLTELDKNKEPGMLNNDETNKLFKTFFLMYKSIKHYKNIRPCVIIKNQEIINFAPFPFKSYEDCDFKFFETFNEACDYYYSHSQKKDYEKEAKQEFDSKINQLEKRLETQEESLEKIKKESDKYAKWGEIVFTNYDLINTIISKIKEANKNNIEWSIIKEMVENEKKQDSMEAKAIKSINESDGTITLNIKGE